jgi:hypothetical protein
VKVYETLDLTHPDSVVGRHGVWLPKLQVKVPFQFGGRIVKYQHPNEKSYPLVMLGEEIAILRALAAEQMAPPIDQWVYFKTVISEHPGGWWADPCGAYGYEMRDAAQLPPGQFTRAKLEAMGRVTGSPGAWSDLDKPGNVLNGYLVDIHRSGWDRLRWEGAPASVPTYMEDPLMLKEDLKREGQFPFRERTEAYQEYFLRDRWWPGEREVVKRAALLGFQVSPGESVLDIGTCLGGFLIRAWQRAHGEGRFIGLDTQPEYLDLARRLARANGANLCFRQWDIGRDLPTLEATKTWLSQVLPASTSTIGGEPSNGVGLTHLLLLSMLKHLPGGEVAVWQIVDSLCPDVSYLETNAVKEGAQAPFFDASRLRGGQLMGWSVDRNRRACYRVPGPRRLTHRTAAATQRAGLPEAQIPEDPPLG